MKIIAAGTRVWMVVMRYPALVQVLWWAAVGAALLASCQPALAEEREGTGDVGPWRGGGAVGEAGGKGRVLRVVGERGEDPGRRGTGKRGCPVSIRTSLRSLERRAAVAMPPPGCGCPCFLVLDPSDPPAPDHCPRCGKNRTIVIVHMPVRPRPVEVCV